jgi:protease-4
MAIAVIMIGALVVVYLIEPDSPVVPIRKGIIGVIEINGVIDTYEYTNLLSAAVNEAAKEDSIKAVVVMIDSPGGSAHLCEQVYLDLLELQKSKPIVTVCSLALSGGYYIAVSSNYIFAQPTSLIGNVGVIGIGPEIIVPSESNIETGPHKITGFSPSLFPLNISKSLENFVEAVINGRKDKLKLTQNQLKKGSVWLGTEASNNGIIDEVGGQKAALDYAAKLVGLEKFSIKNLVDEAVNSSLVTSTQKEFMSIEELNKKNPPPALYFLYMPGNIYMQEENNQTQIIGELEENATILGQVIVDLSHKNKVSPWIFDILEAELAKRGIFVGYSSDWETIEESLEFATCLIIAAPTERYEYEEYKLIQEWIEKGNLLVLFSDPSSSFTSIPELIGPINSIANHWGIHFGKGYLYNQDDNYGIYRNVYIRTFEDTFLTKDIDLLLFYTSTYISSTDSDAAYTPLGTINSVSEQTGLYAPIAVLDKGNTTVIGFGDLSWQVEPYIYSEDNYQLLLNLIAKIVELNSEE